GENAAEVEGGGRREAFTGAVHGLQRRREPNASQLETDGGDHDFRVADTLSGELAAKAIGDDLEILLRLDAGPQSPQDLAEVVEVAESKASAEPSPGVRRQLHPMAARQLQQGRRRDRAEHVDMQLGLGYPLPARHLFRARAEMN